MVIRFGPVRKMLLVTSYICFGPDKAAERTRWEHEEGGPGRLRAEDMGLDLKWVEGASAKLDKSQTNPRELPLPA